MPKKVKKDWKLFYEQQWQARFINRTDDWLEFYNRADTFTKSSILERRAGDSFNEDELRVIFSLIIKRMPHEGRIMYALWKNPHAPEDIKAFAESRYNQIWANTPAAIEWQTKQE